MFTDSQLFIMFEFADCGRDLESYEVSTLNGLKFRNNFLFLFSNKILVIRAGKMFVIIANREDPDQTASSEAVNPGLHCLSSQTRPYWPATSLWNFRRSTVM